MWKDSYWNLFWLSGMPEAWMMTRPMDGYLMSPPPLENLPKEARQLEQNRAEQPAAESVQRSDYIG